METPFGGWVQADPNPPAAAGFHAFARCPPRKPGRGPSQLLLIKVRPAATCAPSSCNPYAGMGGAIGSSLMPDSKLLDAGGANGLAHFRRLGFGELLQIVRRALVGRGHVRHDVLESLVHPRAVQSLCKRRVEL